MSAHLLPSSRLPHGIAALALAACLLAPAADALQRRADATITLEGTTRPVQRAQFGITILTEVWDPETRRWNRGLEHAKAGYWLEAHVDAHSGEDGAPAPEIQRLPVARATGGRHPSLAELGQVVVEERDDGYDCEAWDAWFGNDAPGLCRNVVRFLGWDGPRLRLRWDAAYDAFGQTLPLRVEGSFEFTGIYLTVPADADPDTYLQRAWGGQAADTLDRHALARRDHGENAPEGWRYTVSYVYVPAGTPLPSVWRKDG